MVRWLEHWLRGSEEGGVITGRLRMIDVTSGVPARRDQFCFQFSRDILMAVKIDHVV